MVKRVWHLPRFSSGKPSVDTVEAYTTTDRSTSGTLSTEYKCRSEEVARLSKEHETADGKRAVKSGYSTIDHEGNADHNNEDDDVYPEGGLRAWLVVLGSGCALFMVFGLGNSAGAFQQIFASNLLPNYSAQAIGWIFSLNLFLTFLGGLYVGPWFEAKGPRLLILFGSAGEVAGLLLLGLCTKYWHFMLTYGILCGLSGAMMMGPAYASIAHFFERRRGLATGMASTSGALGGIILPLVIRSLLPKAGFAWATRVIGFIFLALAVPAILFIKRRMAPSALKVPIIPNVSPLKNPRFVLCVMAMFLMEWGLFIPVAYLSSYATSHDQTEAFGFLVITLLNVGSFFGRCVPGFASDKIGRFNTMISANFLCMISVLCMWLPAGNSTGAITAFSLVIGFASGSNLGLITVCVSQLCDIRDFGNYLSIGYFIVSFGTLTSVPIGGALLPAAGGQYYGLIIFSGLSYFATMMLYSSVRILSVGWRIGRLF